MRGHRPYTGWRCSRIPISECSACERPSFVAAAGAAAVMHNIYVLGSMQDWLGAASPGSSAEAMQTAAGTLDETTVMHKLQHLDINTLGLVWARTPADYENTSQVLAAMEVIAPDGTVTLHNK